MKTKSSKGLTTLLEKLLVPVVLVSIWWIASSNSTNPYFPPLADIVRQFPETWFTGRIATDVFPSLGRLGLGILSALILGITLGVLIGSIRWLRIMLEPALEFARAIPAPAMVPLLMVLVGIGGQMRVTVILIGALWPVLLNTIEGVRNIDTTLRDTSAVYKYRPGTKLTLLILRGASPQIFAGTRQALSVSIILMVVSEMFAATNGLGFAIIQFQRSFALTEMWTGVIFLGLLGVVLSILLTVVEKYVLSWYLATKKISA